MDTGSEFFPEVCLKQMFQRDEKQRWSRVCFLQFIIPDMGIKSQRLGEIETLQNYSQEAKEGLYIFIKSGEMLNSAGDTVGWLKSF